MRGRVFNVLAGVSYISPLGASPACHGSTEESSRKSNTPPGRAFTFSSSHETCAEHTHYFSFPLRLAPFHSFSLAL